MFESAMNNVYFKEKVVETPVGNKYNGLLATGEISAVVILRGGAIFEVKPLENIKSGDSY
jgi:uridine kinase